VASPETSKVIKIKVLRSQAEPPSILLSAKAAKALEDARRFFPELDSSRQAQTRFVFDEPIYRASEVRRLKLADCIASINLRRP
jgi:hypothetical protein